MPSINFSFSTWNIPGLSNKDLGDKTKTKDLIDSINEIDFLFLTETWCNRNIQTPGFRAIVSDTATPDTNQVCLKSGVIALLTKAKFEKFVTVVKKLKKNVV